MRYGYGLLAMAKGANAAGARPELYGIDAEADGILSNDRALVNLWPYGERIQIFKMNTRNVDAINAALLDVGTFDLIHIDGDHSEQGIRNEMRIAQTWCRANGCILVDDCDAPHIRSFYEQTCAELGIPTLYLPTAHALGVIDLRQRNRE